MIVAPVEIVEIVVVVPSSISSEEKNLIDKLGELYKNKKVEMPDQHKSWIDKMKEFLKN